MLLKAILAFIYLPGIVAFLVPVLIAMVDPWKMSTIPLGFLGVLFGLVVLMGCVKDFYISGKGTLAPWEPPKKLVVNGFYQFVRNPMYIGVLITVLGWSILFSSPLLVVYGLILAVAFHVRIVKVEEPYLKEQYNDEWEMYRKKVSRWIPTTKK